MERNMQSNLICLVLLGAVFALGASGNSGEAFDFSGILPGPLQAPCQQLPEPSRFASRTLLAAGYAALPVDTEISIVTSGGYLRVDDASGSAYASSGNGSTTAEEFRVYVPGDLASTAGITAGQALILKSGLTGLFCRLAPQITNPAVLAVLCDQAAASATPLTYTGTGLSATSVPLSCSGAGALLLLSSICGFGPSNVSTSVMSFPLAGPP